MATNSHYFQRALLKKVFGNEAFYKHVFPAGEVSYRNVKNLGSKEGLFKGDEDFIKNLENKMNKLVEREVFEKIIKAKKNDEIILSYDETVLLRKYLLITYLRANLVGRGKEDLKALFTNLIDSVVEEDYQKDVDVIVDPAVNFFMENSFIRFIKHKDISLAWPQNYFLSVPIDFQHSDVLKIFRIVNRYPGFLFRIDNENSIIISNASLYFKMHETTKLILNKEMPEHWIRINTRQGDLWFQNINSIIYPDGKDENEFGAKEGIDAEKDFVDKMKYRDKSGFRYRYPIKKMKDSEYEILILDNMMKFVTTQNNLGNEIETYFLNYGQVRNLFKKWKRIEKEVENSNPENLFYWRKDKDRIYKHKVWELILEDQFGYMNNVLKSIEKIKPIKKNKK